MTKTLCLVLLLGVGVCGEVPSHSRLLPKDSIGLALTFASCPGAGDPPPCNPPQRPVCWCTPDGQACTWMCK